MEVGGQMRACGRLAPAAVMTHPDDFVVPIRLGPHARLKFKIQTSHFLLEACPSIYSMPRSHTRVYTVTENTVKT